jgi:16S rRNA (guanine527-N7)-methyltransferase
MCDGAPPDGPTFAGIPALTPEARAGVDRFREMLIDANRSVNLVGASTLGDFWNRHYLDSAQLLALAPEARRWADLGSGAGLPGVILAIALRRAPGVQIHLVESVGKRCRFLESVVAELDLPAVVHNERAEAIALDVDIVTARAVAPLTRLLGYARPSLGRRARGLFLKGSGAEQEVADARRTWRFKSVIHPSLSDQRGRIVEITELRSAA